MHPFTKVQQAMIEEEKWAAPSMTYFRPHFMMPALGEQRAAPAHEPQISNGWLNTYDQALDLGQNQQQQPKPQQQKPPQQQQQHTVVKHEQVDQTRYGFDQVNYSNNAPSTVKKKEDHVVAVPERKYGCDQCSYVATQKSSLSRHKQTQHEGMRQQPIKTGKTYDCDMCPYQATQQTSLKRHQMAKHSGIQYPCDKCDYMGTTPHNLKLHKGSKHEGVRYPCDICGYQATQTGVLNKHKELKHGMTRDRSNINGNPHHSHYSQNKPRMRAICGPGQQGQKPLSGFAHFSSIGKPKLRDSNPDMSDLDLSKELSRRWHALDDLTKAMFEEVAGSEQYQPQIRRNDSQAMVQYNPNRQYVRKRAKKDPSAPKRNLCAFMFFSNSERQAVMTEHPNFGMGHRGEIVKELGRRWGEAPEDVKAPFYRMANEDKVRYEREKHEWHMKQRNNEIEYQTQSPEYSNQQNVVSPGMNATSPPPQVVQGQHQPIC